MLPVKNWLAERFARRKAHGSAFAEAVLAVGPKVLGGMLLAFSVVRLLSSTFRSFLYFQF